MSFKAQKGAPLTVDKVIEALVDVQKENFKVSTWKWIGMKLFSISQSKLSLLTSSCAVCDADRLREVVHFWLTRCPYASWRWLIWRLEENIWLETSNRIEQYAETLTDSTLTLENVSTVMKTMSLFALLQCLGVPFCRQNEILISGTPEEKKRGLILWWLKKSPFVSWEELAGCLYEHEAQQPLRKVKKFVAKTENVVDVSQLRTILTTGRKWTLFGSSSLLQLLHAPISSVKRLCSDPGWPPGGGVNFGPYITECVENHPALSWRQVAYALYQTAGYVECYDILEVVHDKYLRKDINLQDLCKEAIISFIRDDDDINSLPLPKRLKLSIAS